MKIELCYFPYAPRFPVITMSHSASMSQHIAYALPPETPQQVSVQGSVVISTPCPAADDKRKSPGPAPRRSLRVPHIAKRSTEAASSPASSRSANMSHYCPLQVGLPPGSIAAMDGIASATDEVTYTPKMGRISKAKKGKRVHECEFKCGRVRSLRILNLVTVLNIIRSLLEENTKSTLPTTCIRNTWR